MTLWPIGFVTLGLVFFGITRLGRAVGQAVGRIVRAYVNRRDAAVLAGLDARMLADIGLTRSDVRDAFSEPLWRDPTELLVSRAGERRANRVADILVFAPPLVPHDGFTRPALDRPARLTV